MYSQRFTIAAGLCLVLGCSAGRESVFETRKVEATAGESREALIAAGDEAWKSRADAATVEKAIASWERAVELDPTDAATLAKLPHGYYFLADAYLRAEPEKLLATYEKGVAAGERALAAANPEFKKIMTSGGAMEQAVTTLSAEQVESAYWYAASLGRWARAKGFATTLGNRDRIKAVMTKVLESKPELFHGAPDRYWGAFYSVAPGFAGGDMAKSKGHFEKSLERAPYYVGTKVLMADVYAVKQQDRALFDKLLDEVIATPDDINAELIPETRAEKQKAREFKAKAAELF